MKHLDYSIEKDDWYGHYYICRKCGARFMVFDKHDEDAVPVCCPLCGPDSQIDAEGVSKTHPETGTWIPVFDPAALFGEGDPNVIIYYKCSLCGRREPTREPYCNCGAKMKTE